MLITFKVHFGSTKIGQNETVYLAGSIPELGYWEPTVNTILRRSKSKVNVWVSRLISIPPSNTSIIAHLKLILETYGKGNRNSFRVQVSGEVRV